MMQKCFNLLFFLAVSFVLIFRSTHAVAIIVREQPGKTYAELEESSFKLASKFPAVFRVVNVYTNSKTGKEILMPGSGTFFHQDEQFGYLLVSAHSLLFETRGPQYKDLKWNRAKIYEGPEIQVSSKFIEASEEISHPNYGTYTLPHDIEPTSVMNDLAILKFPIEKLKNKIKPFPLYQGYGYKNRQLEAAVVGFGVFGLNTPSSFRNKSLKRLHAGYTYVHYVDQDPFTHLPTFVSFLLPPSHTLTDTWEAKNYTTGTFSTEINLHPDLKEQLFDLKVHPKQAIPESGDSGGPLLFYKKGVGLRVAAIASTGTVLGKQLPNGKFLSLLLKRWEPLQPHMKWIREVSGYPEFDLQ